MKTAIGLVSLAALAAFASPAEAWPAFGAAAISGHYVPPLPQVPGFNFENCFSEHNGGVTYACNGNVTNPPSTAKWESAIPASVGNQGGHFGFSVSYNLGSPFNGPISCAGITVGPGYDQSFQWTGFINSTTNQGVINLGNVNVLAGGTAFGACNMPINSTVENFVANWDL